MNATDPVCFALSGPGEIVALDNGDQLSLEPFQGSQSRRLCAGRCLAIIRSRQQAGSLTLTATVAGLPAATLNISSVAAAPSQNHSRSEHLLL